MVSAGSGQGPQAYLRTLRLRLRPDPDLDKATFKIAYFDRGEPATVPFRRLNGIGL